jgi:hypothetical protein
MHHRECRSLAAWGIMAVVGRTDGDEGAAVGGAKSVSVIADVDRSAGCLCGCLVGSEQDILDGAHSVLYVCAGMITQHCIVLCYRECSGVMSGHLRSRTSARALSCKKGRRWWAGGNSATIAVLRRSRQQCRVPVQVCLY